ncbi:MAG: hypothetical protein N2169_06500 [bacterium]|nr:hypothetical protein [bacterium]
MNSFEYGKELEYDLSEIGMLGYFLVIDEYDIYIEDYANNDIYYYNPSRNMFVNELDVSLDIDEDSMSFIRSIITN